MQIFQIYAVVADGLLALIIVLQSLSILQDWLQKQIALFILQILVYLFFLDRYIILDLCIRFSVIVYTLYWTATVFCILYKTLTVSKISICLENLLLINSISLYAAVYLSMLVDAFEISLFNLRYLYSSVDLITEALATVYVGLNATTDTKDLIDLSVQIFDLTVSLLLYIE